jgi:DNA-binding GntR family transcriptional regulator
LTGEQTDTGPERYRPSTLADSLNARLKIDLYDGGFAPGEAISIRRIAEREGISIIPARDALRGLVGAGALQFRDSRTIVVPPLSADTLSELRYARIAIEGELAELAALGPGRSALQHRLAAIDAEVTQAVLSRDTAMYMRSNRDFHFTIYRAANAPVLLELAEHLWLRFGPGMRIVCDSLDGQLPGQDHHQNALRALADGDAPAFRSALAEDIAQGMDRILAHASHLTHTNDPKKDAL